MSKPITLPEPWKSLAIRKGGVNRLADELGVTPCTVYRWAHGLRKVSGPALKLLAKIGLVLFLCAPLLASTPWTKTDTILEIASEAGIAAEWAQMLPKHPLAGQDMSICGVDAKIMGHHPSRARVNAYFVGWELAHPLISWALPRPWRNVWQGATIGFELAVVPRNASVGCHVRF
jgi:transcriptional regulator with XRE-family HTH domain